MERDILLFTRDLILLGAELLLLEFKQAIFLGHFSAHARQLLLMALELLVFIENHLLLLS